MLWSRRTELILFVRCYFPSLWACIMPQPSVTWLHSIFSTGCRSVNGSLSSFNISLCAHLSMRVLPKTVSAHPLLSAVCCCSLLWGLPVSAREMLSLCAAHARELRARCSAVRKIDDVINLRVCYIINNTAYLFVSRKRVQLTVTWFCSNLISL